MCPDTDNGRVTLAIVQRDILHLTQLVERWHDEDRTRLERLERCLEGIEARVTRNEERIGQTRSFLGILNVILAAVAATIGSLFNPR